MAHGEPGELLERSVELGVIRAAVEAVAAGEGRAVVVEGPAGIGKTALLVAAARSRCARGRAEAAGGSGDRARARVRLRRRAAAARARGPRGDGAAASRVRRGMRRRCFDVRSAEPAPLPLGPEGAFAVLHGLYRLTANLARRRPLALLVDDAHWADGASLRFLAYLGNRLSRVPVLLVVAARPLGEPGGAAVAEMLAEGGAPALLRPPALSDEASASLVRAAVPEAMSPLCRTCHALTGGNPFFLRELAGALREAGADRAADVLGAAPEGVVGVGPGAARPLPRSGPTARRRGGDRGRRRARPARRRARGARRPAGRRGRRRPARRPDPDRQPRAPVRAPDHPQRGPRAAVAGRALGRPRARGAACWPRRTPPLSAWPRICSRPSRAAREWVCDRLRDAAHEAVPRGAPDASVTYLRRALEEPPSPDSRPAVLLELGLAESLTLDRSRRSSTCGAAWRRRRTPSRGSTRRARSRRWSAWTTRREPSRSSSARSPPAPTRTPPWPCISRLTCSPWRASR